MVKKFVALAVGLMAVAGFGAGVTAGDGLPRTAIATPSEVDSSQTFTVVFSPCWTFEDVTFVFQAQQQTVSCVDPDQGDLTNGPQGLKSQALQGTATVTLTAPAAAGTYTGTATATNNRGLQGIRRPAVPALASGGRFEGGSQTCDPGFCATFQVTVRQASTTAPTTAAPTTAAPAAPTTSAVGAVPPAPTTTVATTALPATGPSQNDNAATIAVVLLVVGGALVMATRRRGGQGAT